MRVNNDQVSCGLILILGVLICIHSLHYDLGSLASPSTGFMPLLTGMAVVFFSLLGLTYASFQSVKGKVWTPVLKGRRWDRALTLLLCLIAYSLSLHFLGFILATALFVGFVLRALEGQRWLVVMIWSVSSALASHAVFGVLLKAQLPGGPLGF